MVAAEAAGAPAELVQELRRDADAKAAEASQARQVAADAAAAAGASSGAALCGRLFYEHGPEEIPLAEALSAASVGRREAPAAKAARAGPDCR